MDSTCSHYRAKVGCGFFKKDLSSFYICTQNSLFSLCDSIESREGKLWPIFVQQVPGYEPERRATGHMKNKEAPKLRREQCWFKRYQLKRGPKMKVIPNLIKMKIFKSTFFGWCQGNFQIDSHSQFHKKGSITTFSWFFFTQNSDQIGRKSHF